MNSWQNLKDYYRILNIPYHASADEIRSAYRRLCMEYHPDISGRDTGMQMRLINEAYRTLGNPERKRQYDRRFFSRKPYSTAEKYSGTPATGQPSASAYTQPPGSAPKASPTSNPERSGSLMGTAVVSGVLISIVLPFVMNSIPDLMVWMLILGLGYYLVEWILGLLDIRLGF